LMSKMSMVIGHLSNVKNHSLEYKLQVTND